MFLARYKYFDDTDFFRVIKGFVVQGGDPTGTGTGGAGTGTGGKLKYGYPGYQYTGNTPPASCKTNPNQSACYKPGDLAIAQTSAGPSSDGSQFFFVLPGGQTTLNKEPTYAIIGHVISGTNVLDKIGSYGTPNTAGSSGIPSLTAYLLSVTVKEI